MKPSDFLWNRINQEGSAKHLAVIRIAIGALIFYASFSQIFPLIISLQEHLGAQTIFFSFGDAFQNKYVIFSLLWICRSLSVFMILGLFTRWILPPLAISFILLYAVYYMSGNAPYHWLYIWFPLVLLCFSRSEDAFSLDFKLFGKLKPSSAQAYRWPIELMTAWFVYIYFTAGLAKVLPIEKGLSWLNGITIQKIFHNRFLESPLHYLFGSPLFDYSQKSWLFPTLAFIVLLLEFASIVLIFTRRFNILILCGFLAMHVTSYMIGVAGFILNTLVLGLVLLPQKIFDGGDNY